MGPSLFAMRVAVPPRLSLVFVLLTCGASAVAAATVLSPEATPSRAERRRSHRHHSPSSLVKQPLPSLNLAPLRTPEAPTQNASIPVPVTIQDISPVGVEWHAPIGCDHSGFFFEALTYVLALYRKGVPVSFNVAKCPKSTLDLLSPADAAILLKAQAASELPLPAKRVVSVYHSKLCQASPPSKLYERPIAKVIVRTMTEANSVPESEIKCIHEKHIDQVWLPSQWHSEVYAHAGAPANMLAVVPEAVDTSIFHPGPPTASPVRGQLDAFSGDDTEPSPVKPFAFVSVFKWEYRKGWDVLLEAYFRAFNRKDNVILKLRSYKPAWEMGSADLMSQITDSAKTFVKVNRGRTLADLPRVEWIDKLLSQQELRNLYASSSAFVLPTRGEGWGLPVVEAMAVGLPVICTNASGPTAYLTKENSFELAFTHAAKVVQNVVMTHNKVLKFQPYLEDDGLVEPSAEHLQMLMRKLYDNPKRAADVGLIATADISKRFAPGAVADAMLAQILKMF